MDQNHNCLSIYTQLRSMQRVIWSAYASMHSQMRMKKTIFFVLKLEGGLSGPQHRFFMSHSTSAVSNTVECVVKSNNAYTGTIPWLILLFSIKTKNMPLGSEALAHIGALHFRYSIRIQRWVCHIFYMLHNNLNFYSFFYFLHFLLFFHFFFYYGKFTFAHTAYYMTAYKSAKNEVR